MSLGEDPGPATANWSGVRVWVVAAAIFAAAYLVWLVLAGAFDAFVLLFTGILLAAGLKPSVRKLTKWMPFGAAVAVAFAILLIVIAVVLFVLTAPLVSELVKLVQALPSLAASMQTHFASLQRFIKSDAVAHQIAASISSSAGGWVAAGAGHLLTGPAFAGKMVGNSLLIVMLALGWMMASDELAQFVLSLFPARAREDWKTAFTLIDQRLSAYVAGVVLNGGIVGVAMAIGLAALGVPYSLLLAVVVALAQGIPMVGAVISGIAVIVVASLTVGATKTIIVVAIFAVVQIVDQNVLSPIIFGQRVQMNFLLIIFSTIVGGLLLGIAGAFLAVPAAVVLQVMTVQIMAPAIRRANDAGRPPRSR